MNLDKMRTSDKVITRQLKGTFAQEWDRTAVARAVVGAPRRVPVEHASPKPRSPGGSHKRTRAGMMRGPVGGRATKMLDSQRDVTRAVLDAVLDFLGGPAPDGEAWSFEFGDHLNSNWGAVYGGALSAGMLAVARSATPERSPRSMHVQIVRSVPNGRAFATATVRHPGRTVATVEVDLHDERRKLAAIALFTMVTPEAVAAEYDRTAAAPRFHLTGTPMVESDLIPEAEAAGIVATLAMNARFGVDDVVPHAENVRPSVDGTAASVLECTIPWEDVELTGPEAACLVADAAVGMPVANSYIRSEDIGPNPDLTLRFTAAPATRVVTAASNVLSVQRGTATIGIEIQAGDNQLAHGLATSLLLHRP